MRERCGAALYHDRCLMVEVCKPTDHQASVVFAYGNTTSRDYPTHAVRRALLTIYGVEPIL
ncbi:MAG: hypothetical protein IJZ50_00630 [Alistipes sp.]|nr:hypothetical protein [Alistipes sp.]MBQ8774342.1 hypothetical protein [Alistipes sp.]